MSSGSNGEAIRAEGIGKTYGPVVALRDIDIHLAKGEVLGLIGDNGAGKSTLIKILTGFTQPDQGQIFIDGEEVKLRSVSHARELGIETVYQDLALVNQLPVYANMSLNKEAVHRPIPFLDKKEMRDLAKAHLADMGVRIPSVDTEVGFLSGGQRQAVAIARAVYSDARVILLDEPMAGVSVEDVDGLVEVIRSVHADEGRTVLMVEHRMEVVVGLAQRIAVMHHGALLAFDTPERVMADETVQTAYLGEPL